MNNVVIRTSSSKDIKIPVNRREFPIAELKQRVFEVLGDNWTPDRQRLFFQGKQLEDQLTIFSYNVKYGDTIQLFPKPVVQVDEEEMVKKPEISLPKKANPEEVPDEEMTEQMKADMELASRIAGEDPLCDMCTKRPNRKCKDCGCNKCGLKTEPEAQVRCDECDYTFHFSCLGLPEFPTSDDWFCPDCKNDNSKIITAGKSVVSAKKSKSLGANQAKAWGGGVSCSGVTKCTIVPPEHVGPIPGVPVGSVWKHRINCAGSGVHRPPVAGIAGTEKRGCVSIVLSAGYPEDKDDGLEFTYTGSGGRDLKTGNKRTGGQSFDQTLTKSNAAIAATCDAPMNKVEGAVSRDWKKSKAIRVVRGFKLAKHSIYAPVAGYRYDGIYKCVKYWPEKSDKSGFLVWRYLMRRDDDEHAPWTDEGKAKMEELGIGKLEEEEVKENLEPIAVHEPTKKKQKVSGTSAEGSSKSDTDDDFVKLISKPKKKICKVVIMKKSSDNSFKTAKGPAPAVRKFVPSKKVMDLISSDSTESSEKNPTNERSWAEVLETPFPTELAFIEKVELVFMCPVCQCTVTKPITTECTHNICSDCFARNCSATERLGTDERKDLKIVPCPTCRKELLLETLDKNRRKKSVKRDVNERLEKAMNAVNPAWGI